MQALSVKSERPAPETADPCGFDFRTRLFVSLIVSTVTVFLSDTAVLATLAALSFFYLLASTRRYKIVAGAYVLMGVMTVLSILVITGTYALIEICAEGTKAESSVRMLRGAVLDDFYTPFLRTLPSMNVILALVLNLSVQKFTGTLKALRMPRVVFLPLLVFCRFVPEFIDVVRQLRDAARMRGFAVTFGSAFIHPLQTIRLTVVPLAVKTLRMGDNLAMAAEMKRVGYARRPTHLNRAVMRSRDYLTMALTVGVIASILIWQANVPQKAYGMRKSTPTNQEVSR